MSFAVDMLSVNYNSCNENDHKARLRCVDILGMAVLVMTYKNTETCKKIKALLIK